MTVMMLYLLNLLAVKKKYRPDAVQEGKTRPKNAM